MCNLSLTVVDSVQKSLAKRTCCKSVLVLEAAVQRFTNRAGQEKPIAEGKRVPIHGFLQNNHCKQV